MKDAYEEKYKLIKNEDDTYSSKRDFRVPKELVENGKLKIKFKKISGWFDCSCLGLTTLEGFPDYVHGSFFCDNNNLESFDFLPKKITGIIYCHVSLLF